MEYKLEPDGHRRGSNEYKYYKYGPFFVQTIKTYSVKWNMTLSGVPSAGPRSWSVHLGYREFRATNRNVQENLKQLMTERGREIILNIFENGI